MSHMAQLAPLLAKVGVRLPCPSRRTTAIDCRLIPANQLLQRNQSKVVIGVARVCTN